MQSLHDRSHLAIVFQKAQSHISMVLFVAIMCEHAIWDYMKKVKSNGLSHPTHYKWFVNSQIEL